MRPALPIEAALIRTAKARILMLEEAIEGYHEGDPERRRLQTRLTDERNNLVDRLRRLEGG